MPKAMSSAGSERYARWKRRLHSSFQTPHAKARYIAAVDHQRPLLQKKHSPRSRHLHSHPLFHDPHILSRPVLLSLLLRRAQHSIITLIITALHTMHTRAQYLARRPCDIIPIPMHPHHSTWQTLSPRNMALPRQWDPIHPLRLLSALLPHQCPIVSPRWNNTWRSRRLVIPEYD